MVNTHPFFKYFKPGQKKLDRRMKETLLYQKKEGKRVVCNTCPRRCQLESGQKGFCRVRENIEGTLELLTYGKAVAAGVDPVEKKPFFNFAPGTRAFSISTMGCTLDCDFCQNASISREWDEIQGQDMPPEEVVRQTKRNRCQGIAYTYTEPTVFLEYCLDTMDIAEDEKYNVFVSNGFMTPETVERVSEKLDAINIDLKGDKKFYREHCAVPDPEPIFEAIKKFSEKDVHLELTSLIIPGENDSEEDIRERVRWIRENTGKDTPLHLSRFHPARNLLDKPPTPLETLEKALEIAKEEGLEYVYCGNVPGHESESTYCPSCGELVIKRKGYRVKEMRLEGRKCAGCGKELNVRGVEYMQN